jgi:hypothetical protein
MYYLIFYITISLCSFFELLSKRKSYILYIILALLLFLFVGFRTDKVGPDYISYTEIFYKTPPILNYFDNPNIYFDFHIEWLFFIFNSLLRQFDLSHIYMFAITSFVAVFINLYFFRTLSPYFVLTVLLYYSHIYINKEFIQIRVGLASSMLFFSIKYIHYQNFFKFIAISLLCSLIHLSSLIIIPVYFLYKLNLSSISYFILILSSIILSFQYDLGYLFTFLSDINLLPYGVVRYIGSDLHYDLGLSNLVTVKQIIISLLLLSFRRRFKNYKYFEVMLCMYLVSTLWLIIFDDFAIIAARVAALLSFVEVLLIPLFILLFKQKLIIYSFIVLYGCYVLYLNIYEKELLSNYDSHIFNLF